MRFVRYIYLIILFTHIISYTFAQSKTLSGYVVNENNEAISFVRIVNLDANIGIYTDESGYFKLITSEDTLKLSFSHLGVDNTQYEYTVTTDTLVTIVLNSHEIDEVLVRSQPLSEQAILGYNVLSSKELNYIPTFFGQNDLVKSLSILPGVSNAHDMYSNLVVRGGNIDQNSFVVDGVHMLYSSHLGGLVSQFNPNIVDQVHLYKGSIPAQYSDATSAVIDVVTKQAGSSSQLVFDIGSLFSGLSYSSSDKHKLQLHLAGRMSLLNLMNGSTQNGITLDENETGVIDRFWDSNAKIVYTPRLGSTLFVALQAGNDLSSMQEQKHIYVEELDSDVDVRMNSLSSIGHKNISLGYDRKNSKKINHSVRMWWSHYNNSFNMSDNYPNDMYKAYFEDSYFKELSIKAHSKLFLNKASTLNIGLQYTHHNSLAWENRNVNTILDLDSIMYTSALNQNNKYSSFAEFNLSKGQHTISAGFYASMLYCVDTMFLSFEPRMSYALRLGETMSMRCGVNKSTQSFHQVLSTIGYFQEERWITANASFAPQNCWQFSSGFYGMVPKTSIDFSIEGYYKMLDNLIYFASPTQEIVDYYSCLEKDGTGKSWGSEFLLSQSSGTIQWSLSYALSWANRQFEGLNRGEMFASDFDRRHDLNLRGSFFLDKSSFHIAYLFQTGKPVTLPSYKMFDKTNGSDIYIIESVNNHRLPNYKRLDISYKRSGKIFRNRHYDLSLSVINVLMRKNATNLFVRNGETFISYDYQLMPSIHFSLQL